LNEDAQAVQVDGEEQELQLDGQAPQAVPSVVGAYPDGHEQDPEAKVNPEKQTVATVADEHELAPVAHLTHDDPTNPYPGTQVRAVVLEVQVAAPVPQALQVLLV
jgi:hypothetical protein